MLTILLSKRAAATFGNGISDAMGARAFRVVTPDDIDPDGSHVAGVDIAFISRDVTGMSTKTTLEPSLSAFYRVLRASPALQWVNVHSAGIDRPIFAELMARGVRVTMSSGVSAPVVAQSALAGLLALARRFPQLMEAQRRHAWEPLLGAPPPSVEGQTAMIVGYGPIGQRLRVLLEALGIKVLVVRREADDARGILPFAQWDHRLNECQWLVLACPLTPLTRHLVDAQRLGRLPHGAHLINVARGEVVVEADVVAALQSGQLAGAYLDVFATEPLNPASPLWDLPRVIVSPHTAGQASGHFEAVGHLWLENLARWVSSGTLCNEAKAAA